MITEFHRRLSLPWLDVSPACSQTVQETKSGQFSLHPVSVNDSQEALSSPLLLGLTTRLRGLPFDPCLARIFFFFFLSNLSTAPLTSPPIRPPKAPRTMAYSPAPALHYGVCGLAVQPGLRFQPHVLLSNQKSQPWQRGRITGEVVEGTGGGGTERKSTSGEGVEEGRGENKSE